MIVKEAIPTYETLLMSPESYFLQAKTQMEKFKINYRISLSEMKWSNKPNKKYNFLRASLANTRNQLCA